MRRLHSCCFATAAVTLAFAAGFAATPVKAKDFYEGKTIKLIIPFAQSGGSGQWARAVEPHLRKVLGDKTSFQVVFKPGAGSVAGANEWYARMRPDGTNVLLSSGSTVMPWILEQKQVKYDFRKMTPIVAQAVAAIVFATKKVGGDAAKWKKPVEPLVAPGITVTGADLARVLAFEVLDIPIKFVFGYKSNGEAYKAMLSGEGNVGVIASPGYASRVVPEVERGTFVPVMNLGTVNAAGELVRDPIYPDMPTPRDIYKTMNGKDPSGLPWDAYKSVVGAAWSMQKVAWLHEKAPKAAKLAIQSIFEKTLKDPKVRALLAKKQGDYPFYFGEKEISPIFYKSAELKPETKAWMIKFLREKYKAKI